MRVRYGKPIKVKSLLGKQNSIILDNYYSNIGTYRAFGDGKYIYSTGSNLKTRGDSFSTITLNTSHAYLFVRLDSISVSNAAEYVVDSNGSLTRQRDTYIPTGTSLTLISFTNISEFIGWQLYRSGGSEWDSSFYPIYYFLLDLTDIFGSGNEPTKANFYTKYNKYFSLIATGEEITIDDRAGQVSISRLPSEYQEVEYIESTGTQYINTNYVPNAPVKAEYSFMITGTVSSGHPIAGVFNSSNDIYLGLVRSADSKLNYRYGVSFYPSTTTIIENTKYEAVVNLEVGLQSLTLNGILEETSNNSISFANNLTLYLFQLNGAPSVGNLVGRIYYFKIYSNSALVRDFVPCYRKSDNEIGLYDLVGKQFYTNQGTGTFLKGNNVNNTISCKVAGGSSDIYYGYNQHSPLWSSGSYKDVTVTATNGGRGISLANTATGWFTYDSLFNVTIPSGHKVLVDADVVNNTGANFGYRLRYNNETTVYSGKNFSQIITLSGNINKLQLYGDLGDDLTGITLDDCIVIDLTEWYGPGKEPTTVAEFKEKFNQDYYGYCSNKTMLTQFMINALPIYGYNQQAENGDFALASGWYSPPGQNTLSISNNEGTVTVINDDKSWAGEYRIQHSKNTIAFNQGDKYIFLAELKMNKSASASDKLVLYIQSIGPNSNSVTETFTVTNIYKKYGFIFEVSTSYSDPLRAARFNSKPSIGDSFSCRNFQIINLTEWYGAGSEPTTVEEFKATFPNKYYPYSKKRLLNKYMINKLID